MKIYKAPMSDLLEYMGELYVQKDYHNYGHVFEIIDDYYCKLSSRTSILPLNGLVLQDWCQMNCDNTMETCPNIPGIIVYKTLRDGNRFYGFLYTSGYIVPKKYQTNNLSYYFVNPQGFLDSHTYLDSEWEGWGAPVRFFEFDPDIYVDNETYCFGERVLHPGNMGHDIKIFQELLKKVFPDDIKITGHFDEPTLKALYNIQQFCGVPVRPELNLRTQPGKRVLGFLMQEKKPDIQGGQS